MRQIADEMQVTEKTLKRMLSDEAGSPSLNTLVQFLRSCRADIDDIVDIFAEVQLFLVRKPAAEIDQQNTELHNELNRARAEIDELLARVADLTAERETLREKNDKLRDELLDLYRAGKG
jgi:predicted nuclease with TOPRIM domain